MIDRGCENTRSDLKLNCSTGHHLNAQAHHRMIRHAGIQTADRLPKMWNMHAAAAFAGLIPHAAVLPGRAYANLHLAVKLMNESMGFFMQCVLMLFLV